MRLTSGPSTRDPVDAPYLSSMHAPTDEVWNSWVEVVSPKAIPAALPWLVKAVRSSRGRTAFILRGTSGLSDRYRDFLFAAIVRRINPRARIVMSDATIEPGSKGLARVLPRQLTQLVSGATRGMVRMVDGENVVWCVLSTDEIPVFAATWGVPVERVVFTPFSHTLHGVGVPDLPKSASGLGHVFSGGNSLRDYVMMLEALEGIDVDLRVATSWAPPQSEPRRASFRSTSHKQFIDDMAGSSVVVLPLEASTRSTGQQTYLNAMALGRVVVVNDVAGVRDYIEHGVTGIIVSSVEEMRAAVLDVLDAANQGRYLQMGRRAREAVLSRWTPDHYRRTLLALAGRVSQEEAAAGRTSTHAVS